MSKKYKQKMAADKDNLEQLNVYDYCDKMMKELGQHDGSGGGKIVDGSGKHKGLCKVFLIYAHFVIKQYLDSIQQITEYFDPQDGYHFRVGSRGH